MACRVGLTSAPKRRVPGEWIPDYTSALTLDVILGAQVDRFLSKALESFFTEPYTLSTRSDRMGARLDGPVLEILGEGLISEGISLGATQVPADGRPILLLNDRQTVGGIRNWVPQRRAVWTRWRNGH